QPIKVVDGDEALVLVRQVSVGLHEARGVGAFEEAVALGDAYRGPLAQLAGAVGLPAEAVEKRLPLRLGLGLLGGEGGLGVLRAQGRGEQRRDEEEAEEAGEFHEDWAEG